MSWSYPGRRKNENDEIQASVKNCVDDRGKEAEWALFRYFIESAPVCSEVSPAVEEQTKEERGHPTYNHTYQDPTQGVEDSSYEDSTVEEKDRELDEAQGERLEKQDDPHDLGRVSNAEILPW